MKNNKRKHGNYTLILKSFQAHDSLCYNAIIKHPEARPLELLKMRGIGW